jgi:hypothetical protein
VMPRRWHSLVLGHFVSRVHVGIRVRRLLLASPFVFIFFDFVFFHRIHAVVFIGFSFIVLFLFRRKLLFDERDDKSE